MHLFSQSFHQGQTISDKSFLITGGAGFIGSHIVDYLVLFGAKKVVVLDNLSTGFEKNYIHHLGKPNFDFIKGDITNFEQCNNACKNIDIVIHQAALGSVPRSIKEPIVSHAANASGFLNVLFAAKENGVKRFVYASSSSVYGDSALLPKDETHVGRLLSPYAVTKKINEMYADVFALNYQMEVVGLRYFNVYGPRQNPYGPYAAVIPLFVKAIQAGQAPQINGDGTHSRDFTFVADAVQANIKAALTSNSDAFSKVYNVAAEGQTDLNELVTEINHILGTNVSPNYREERPGDIKHSFAQIDLAKNMLGYVPKYPLNEGLKLACKWYAENN